MEIPWSTAVANILCRNHNQMLSPLDSEAGRLRNALEELSVPIDPLQGEGLWTGARRIVLSGSLIKRWIAKTWSNITVLQDENVSEGFVRYAFGEYSDSVRIWNAPNPGQRLEVSEGHLWGLPGRSPQGEQAFMMGVFGLVWIGVDNHRPSQQAIAFGDDPPIPIDSLMEHPQEYIAERDVPDIGRIPVVRIEFDWDE